MNKKNVPVCWTQVDGLRVCYRAAPAAPAPAEASPRLPVLLLHGLGCSSEAWWPSLCRCMELGLPHPVIAADFPGCGHSHSADHALSMDELADWAARLLDALGFARVHVAGNSMGGQVVLALGRRHPDRVGGLALLGPTTGNTIESFGRYTTGLLRDGVAESPRYNLLLLKMYAQMGLRRYLATVRHMMADDPMAQIAQVQAPCIVLRGGHDRIIPEDVARELAAALPHGQYQPLDSTAHAAEYNTPDLFVAALLEFIKRVEVGTPDRPVESSPSSPGGRDQSSSPVRIDLLRKH